MKDYSKIIIDYWNNHQNDEKFASIVSASDFYFQEVQSLLKQWQTFEVKDIDSLIQMNYEEFKTSEDLVISQIRELLFKIIAFCDTNAYKGESYNPERRIIAKAMVRQSNWVRNFLKWRKGNDISSAPSVKNAINYILDPQHNLTMLSENQRRKFSKNVLKKNYEPRTFCEDAIPFCKKIFPSVKVQNESNLTWLYSCLIYSIESEWLTSNVQGVLAKDSGEWQHNLLGQSYCSFGWDEVSDFNDIKGDLRLLIERDGCFPFYNVSNWETNYYGKVVDFADSKDDYNNRVEDWKERAPGQYFGTFEEYGKRGKPKIILLCEKIEKMAERLGQNQFQFYNRLPSVKNMVGFTKILAKKTNEDMMMDNYVAILKNKKNIILQGAPGTGKTYKTAELALSIIEELPTRNAGEDEMSFHKRVMDTYDAKIIKLNRDGSFANPGAQIGFVTFHQSMDYEDFVEGIKPKTNNGQISYEIESGIFKTICENASQIKSSRRSEKIDFSNVRIFKMSLGEKGKTDTEIFDYCSENNVIALSWGGNIDFSDCETREQIKAKDSSWGAFAIEVFKLWMHVGDIVLISDGNRAIKAIARITGEYEFHADKLETMRQYRNVEWLYIGDSIPISKIYDKKLSQQSIYAFGNRIDENHVENGSIKEDVINDIITGEIEKENLKNYVLIIDEINRGNVSKIFGELISLLEADKRVGGDHPLSIILPYSKESFSVPSNLYIIGTMNTTDRSVGSIDYAVRRRFAFVTLEADENKVSEGDARNLFNAVKNFLNKSKYDMDIEDLMVGHSYFMDAENLQMKWQYEILPLLMEYHKDGIIDKSPLKNAEDKEIVNCKKDYQSFINAWPVENKD